MYIYSLKSPVSKQKYPKRLAKFFAFVGLPQNIPIEEQSKVFIVKSAGDPDWAFDTILKFVMAQLERVKRGFFVSLFESNGELKRFLRHRISNSGRKTPRIVVAFLPDMLLKP